MSEGQAPGFLCAASPWTQQCDLGTQTKQTNIPIHTLLVHCTSTYDFSRQLVAKVSAGWLQTLEKGCLNTVLCPVS